MIFDNKIRDFFFLGNRDMIKQNVNALKIPPARLQIF